MQEFDASKNIEDLHQEIRTAAEKLLLDIKPKIDLLWNENDILP